MMERHSIARDKLYMIEPGFALENRPGHLHVCRACNQLEGLLRSFPVLAAKIDVERVPFPRPRQRVIDEIGEPNQSLPVLIMTDNQPAGLTRAEDKAFVNDLQQILALLATRHGFPEYS